MFIVNIIIITIKDTMIIIMISIVIIIISSSSIIIMIITKAELRQRTECVLSIMYVNNDMYHN